MYWFYNGLYIKRITISTIMINKNYATHHYRLRAFYLPFIRSRVCSETQNMIMDWILHKNNILSKWIIYWIYDFLLIIMVIMIFFKKFAFFILCLNNIYCIINLLINIFYAVRNDNTALMMAVTAPPNPANL